MKKLLSLFLVATATAFVAQAQPASQQCTIKLYDYWNKKYATPMETELTYADGVFTIEDFCNSGCRLSFTKGGDYYDFWWGSKWADTYQLIPVGDNIEEWTFHDVGVDQYGAYDYLYNMFTIFDDFSGEMEQCQMVIGNWDGSHPGEEEVFYYPEINQGCCYFDLSGEIPCIYMEFDVSSIPYDEESDERYEDEDHWQSYYLYMDFDMGEDNAAEGIQASDAAPVYYNLQGVRVANPEKGLFIKSQDGKASKVIL